MQGKTVRRGPRKNLLMKKTQKVRHKELICVLYDGANTKAEVKRNTAMKKIRNFVLEILL